MSNEDLINEHNSNNKGEGDDLDAATLLLRAALEEQVNRVNHLERSQVELLEALEECPTDDDFILAIRENEILLKTKRSEIFELEKHLKRKDPAYKLAELPGSTLYNPVIPGISISVNDDLSIPVIASLRPIISTLQNNVHIEEKYEIVVDQEGLYL
jgi:hypothetical protein